MPDSDNLWLSADEVLALALERPPYNINSADAFCDGFAACQDRIRVLLDRLMREYTRGCPDSPNCKWDDALSVWAYGHGFDAGTYHASLKENKK